jgi:hypothetical protein
LPDEDHESGRNSREQVYGADISIFAPSRTHTVLDGEGDVRRLTGRGDPMRIGTRPADVNNDAQRRKLFLMLWPPAMSGG